ncbi:hypothetical protein ALC56_09228, partial [Trachymyrmex septentrionalis]
RLRANDVDEMLLSGEHVTRPRRIEINAFASRIPALIPFPPIIFPFPTVPPDALSRHLTSRIALHSHDGSPQSQELPSLSELEKSSSSYDRPETVGARKAVTHRRAERSEGTSSFPQAQGHSFILTEFERGYEDGAMAIGDAPSACG